MFKRLSALIKRMFTAPPAEEPDLVEGKEVSKLSASPKQLDRFDALEELPSPLELSLEEHFLNLENTELLLQQALHDPLQFLKDYGDADFFQLEEDDPRVLTAPLPEVRYERSPGAMPSRPLLTDAGQRERLARGGREPAPLTSSQPQGLAPRAPLPKIKVPKKKRSKEAKSERRVKYVKRSGDSFIQQSAEERDQIQSPLEYAYLLPYNTIKERSRAPSRYDHLSAHTSYAASERAAAMRTVIDSLDELITIHEESIKRREAFFESIQELIESKQLHYTEADAWWFHYNRATSYLEEQRVLKGARVNHGALRSQGAQRAPERSRSTRRELSKLQTSLEMAHVNAPKDAQPSTPPTGAPAPTASRAATRPSEVTHARMPAPNTAQSSAVASNELLPAHAKSHKKKGSGRLFSSKLPRHDISVYDPETLSRDPSSLSLAELEMTMRPGAIPPVEEEDR